MRKTSFLLAVIATVMLVACQREKEINTPVAGENEVTFILQGAPSTRATDSMAEVKSVSIPVQVEGSDEYFCLEETIEDLNAAYIPVTRGTPAYTENVGNLYANKLSVYAAGKFGDATFANLDEEMVAGGWRYHHNYNKDPWPDETTTVDFYLRMPSDMTSKGVSGLEYGKADGNLTISFDYESPETGAAQQDIIFAARSINKANYKKTLPNGTSVLFNHALTGVKFRLGHNNDGVTKTNISKVVFHGLINKGSCIVTPASENDYQDITGTYSSATAAVWTTAATDTTSFTQEFDNSNPQGDNVVNYTSGDFASSFYQAGNTRNLNDDDASFTFWFIPQMMNENVTLEVCFTVYDGRTNLAEGKTNVHEHVLKLNLGSRILGQTEEQQALTKDWRAGQLRTFTLKPNAVGVDIDDELEEYVKSDVVITNTGNVMEYVRVNIIGNWVGYLWEKNDANGNPVYSTDKTIMNGYAAETGEAVVDWSDLYGRVLPWNDKEPAKANEYYTYGEFVGLPAKSSTEDPVATNNWVRLDKYYYYILPIGPGESVLPSTAPLFESYTIGPSPDFWIPDIFGTRHKANDVHLEMDLAVQAIEAPTDADGNVTKNYMEAWAIALGLADENDNPIDVSGLDDL